MAVADVGGTAGGIRNLKPEVTAGEGIEGPGPDGSAVGTD